MTLILIKILCSLIFTYIIAYNYKFDYQTITLQVLEFSTLVVSMLTVFSFIWIGV